MWEREGGREGGRVGGSVLKFIFWLMTDLRSNPSCCQMLSMILMICNVNIPVEKGGGGGGIVSQARYVTAAPKKYKVYKNIKAPFVMKSMRVACRGQE